MLTLFYNNKPLQTQSGKWRFDGALEVENHTLKVYRIYGEISNNNNLQQGFLAFAEEHNVAIDRVVFEFIGNNNLILSLITGQFNLRPTI
jgi:hypothetical protein